MTALIRVQRWWDCGLSNRLLYAGSRPRPDDDVDEALERALWKLPPCEHGVYPADDFEAENLSWFVNDYAMNGPNDRIVYCLGGWHDVRDAHQTHPDGSPWRSEWGGHLVPVYCLEWCAIETPFGWAVMPW